MLTLSRSGLGELEGNYVLTTEKRVHTFFHPTLKGLDVDLSTVARGELDAANDHRHQRGVNVRNRQLNTLFQAHNDRLYENKRNQIRDLKVRTRVYCFTSGPAFHSTMIAYRSRTNEKL
ncbi:hypothetical protein EVAR_48044_1 [Eumeta japonica]|uniref:Uncharacterized protein n=1 Tax=Eumeta variegata TaxID=151549 RepID=A0A4C1XK69_EUMVA|nr:hypothetical protein EVAR_48044_1 [Eumeta japonica]